MLRKIYPSRDDRIARHPAGKTRKPQRRQRLWLWAKWTTVAAIWMAVVLGGIVAWYAADLPHIDQAPTPTRKPAITVLADDGPVLATLGDVHGRPLAAPMEVTAPARIHREPHLHRSPVYMPSTSSARRRSACTDPSLC